MLRSPEPLRSDADRTAVGRLVTRADASGSATSCVVQAVEARLVAALSVAVAGAWFSRTYVAFQREMRTQRARLSQGSEVIETTSGAVEYGRAGECLPVLISHGGAGSYDQGLLTARAFLDEGFQAIAPSRFGHLRTPLARDSSAEAQADAYAQLLDDLHVERAAILGLSGGGPSSLQFALHHPRRCVALVMSAAVSQYVPARSTGVYRSDFLYWLVTTYLRRMALGKIGVGRDEQARHAVRWAIELTAREQR